MSKLHKLRWRNWYILLIFSVLAGALLVLAARLTRVPILMYHHITRETTCNSMTVTERRFREDMEFLQQNGYTALLPTDLIAIASGERSLPRKPVMITFDDGYESNFLYAYPILRETGMKATIAVITSTIRDDDGAAGDPIRPLSWAQCREMQQSGIVDIGSHSFALHNADSGGNPHPDGHDGIARRAGEMQDAYRARVGGDLRESVQRIRARTGSACTYFSYPFGAGDAWADPLLRREGIFVSTTTASRTAHLAFGTHTLPRLRVTMNAPLSFMLK